MASGHGFKPGSRGRYPCVFFLTPCLLVIFALRIVSRTDESCKDESELRNFTGAESATSGRNGHFA